MKRALKKLWDKLMTTEILPIVLGLLTVLAMIIWLIAAATFGVVTILNIVGVI